MNTLYLPVNCVTREAVSLVVIHSLFRLWYEPVLYIKSPYCAHTRESFLKVVVNRRPGLGLNSLQLTGCWYVKSLEIDFYFFCIIHIFYYSYFFIIHIFYLCIFHNFYFCFIHIFLFRHFFILHGFLVCYSLFFIFYYSYYFAILRFNRHDVGM